MREQADMSEQSDILPNLVFTPIFISNAQIHAMKVLEKEKILKQNLVRYAMTERKILSTIKIRMILSKKF